jgi:hypothetical protein
MVFIRGGEIKEVDDWVGVSIEETAFLVVKGHWGLDSALLRGNWAAHQLLLVV